MQCDNRHSTPMQVTRAQLQDAAGHRQGQVHPHRHLWRPREPHTQHALSCPRVWLWSAVYWFFDHVAAICIRDLNLAGLVGRVKIGPKICHLSHRATPPTPPPRCSTWRPTSLLSSSTWVIWYAFPLSLCTCAMQAMENCATPDGVLEHVTKRLGDFHNAD